MAYRKPDSEITRKTFLNDKPKKKGQGTHKVHKIDTPEYQGKVEMVYEYIKQGMRSNEIYALMMVEDEKLTERAFHELLRHAYLYAENALHRDREYVFQLHMDRYERTYEKNLVMVDSWNNPLDPKKHWHIMVAKYVNALKALESKEKLVGLHDKSVSLEFTDQKVIIEEKEDDRGKIPGYDINKLSFEEQKELLALIKECRTVPIEGIQRVVIKKTVIEINTDTGDRTVEDVVETEDIPYEELHDEVVSKMQVETTPKEEDEIPAGPLLIDSVKITKKPKQAEDVERTLQKSALDVFREKLKQKKK